MKTKTQLLQEQNVLKAKLAQVTKQINLQEVSRMQQIAGVKSKRFLKENFGEGDYEAQKERVLEWFDMAFEGEEIDTRLRSQISQVLNRNSSMSKELFEEIWGMYTSKYSTHDVGADWETFDETLNYIMNGSW